MSTNEWSKLCGIKFAEERDTCTPIVCEACSPVPLGISAFGETVLEGCVGRVTSLTCTEVEKCLRVTGLKMEPRRETLSRGHYHDIACKNGLTTETTSNKTKKWSFCKYDIPVQEKENPQFYSTQNMKDTYYMFVKWPHDTLTSHILDSQKNLCWNPNVQH